MSFEQEYLIRLNKYVRDKCSKICDFDSVEDKIFLDVKAKLNKQDLVLYRENFQCLEKCSAKYFESGVLSLASLSDYMLKK